MYHQITSSMRNETFSFNLQTWTKLVICATIRVAFIINDCRTQFITSTNHFLLSSNINFDRRNIFHLFTYFTFLVRSYNYWFYILLKTPTLWKHVHDFTVWDRTMYSGRLKHSLYLHQCSSISCVGARVFLCIVCVNYVKLWYKCKCAFKLSFLYKHIYIHIHTPNMHLSLLTPFES